MKKDLLLHITFWLAFFIFSTLIKGWISLSYINFWLGGLIGVLLPDIDYFIYSYFLKPKEKASLEIASSFSQKRLDKSLDLIATKYKNVSGLLVHSALFQLILLVSAFTIGISTGLLGKGLILSFLLHLLIDEVQSLRSDQEFNRWFEVFPFNLTLEQKKLFLFANFISLFILILMF